MVFSTVLVAAVSLLVLLYAFVKKSYSYWSSRDVLQAEPSFPLGNLQGITTKRHPADITRELYNKYVGQGQFVGTYFFQSPVALGLDPEFIKNVLVRDFSYFHDRGLYHNEQADPLSAHLFSLEGTQWKNLRAKLTPTFTSGKMKIMFETVNATAHKMADHIHGLADSKENIDIKDIVSRYGMDSIGACAFGIECNCLDDPDVKFRINGKKIFEPPRHRQVIVAFLNSYPKIGKMFGLRAFDKGATEFFDETTRSTVKYRQENNVERKDLLQLLLNFEDKLTGGKLTVNEISAQTFLFFLAGFETSATTMQFCLYEMALNQEVQDRAREEIQKALEKNGGKMTYEEMLQLPYLDKCIYETLRKYPAVDNLFRMTNRDYQVPGTKHIIEKGTRVCIPVYGMQRDPNLYPNPEKFDPERFDEGNVKTRHPFTFLPFGEGPRVCIGLRFGMMQARLGIVSILMKYRLKSCADTPKKININIGAFLLAPDKIIKLQVEHL